MVASWSHDPSRKVGSVIVDIDRRIVSTGYNGFPAGVIDSEVRYNNRELKYRLVKHAEDNAIAFSHKSDLRDCTLYSTLYPCAQCAGSMIRAGIRRVVVQKSPDFDNDRLSEDFRLTREIFEECGVVVTMMQQL